LSNDVIHDASHVSQDGLHQNAICNSIAVLEPRGLLAGEQDASPYPLLQALYLRTYCTIKLRLSISLHHLVSRRTSGKSLAYSKAREGLSGNDGITIYYFLMS
jgi:hypothetical protein